MPPVTGVKFRLLLSSGNPPTAVLYQLTLCPRPTLAAKVGKGSLEQIVTTAGNTEGTPIGGQAQLCGPAFNIPEQPELSVTNMLAHEPLGTDDML